jgi:hypothetical protein
MANDLMIQVESTSLERIGYDPKRRTLFVLFKSGGFYEFFRVGPLTFGKLRRARSKGRFFAAHIRGNYESQRLWKATTISHER